MQGTELKEPGRPDELGRTAMDMLARLLEGQDEPGRQVRLAVPVRG